MKKQRFTSGMAMLLCLCALVSCGADADITAADTTGAAVEAEETTAVSEPEITSGNPADLDLGGETIRLWYTTGWDSYTDIAGAQSGDVLDDAV